MCTISRLGPILAVIVGASAVVLGCDEQGEQKAVAVSLAAKPIGYAECAACGMVVSEQPAPRMQVVHRDGHRAYFCSIGDSLHYLSDKNAHGAPAAVYVEALEPSMEPMERETKGHPWILASDAVFVTGVERTGVMGEPVLAFRTVSEAETLTERYSGKVTAWDGVRERLVGKGKSH